MTEVENKNFKELNELRNLNAQKDEEILSLHQNLLMLQKKLEGLKHMKAVKAENEEEANPEESHDKDDEEEDDDDFLLKIMATHKHVISPVEEKLRADIDQILEENLEFWMRFSASFSQIQKFQDEIDDLHKELTKIEHRRREATGSSTGRNMGLDTRPIYRHMKQIQTDLGVWVDKSVALRDELQRRFTQLCNIQKEITRALNDGAIDDEMKFTSFQAAKFQGEVLNMQQENNKVGDELQAGLDHVTNLQSEVERTLNKLSEDLGLSGLRNQDNMQRPQGNQVPLKSLLFGVKPKKQKQSIFSSVNPSTLQKKYQQLKF